MLLLFLLNTEPPLDYLLPGLFDFKREPGSWKPVKTKGPSFSHTRFVLELFPLLFQPLSMPQPQWIACCTLNALCQRWAFAFAVLPAWITFPPFYPLPPPSQLTCSSSMIQLPFYLGNPHCLPSLAPTLLFSLSVSYCVIVLCFLIGLPNWTAKGSTGTLQCSPFILSPCLTQKRCLTLLNEWWWHRWDACSGSHSELVPGPGFSGSVF